jgi:hypothetical protein
MSEQMSLFDMASLDPVARVKEAMRQAIKASGFSRDQVVDLINDLARRDGIATNGRAKEVSPEILDKWLAPGAEHLMPWKLLPIFCRAVDSLEPMKALAAPLGARVIGREDAALLEWAKADRERRKIVKRQKRLEMDIGI